jgi:hypothetical protein
MVRGVVVAIGLLRWLFGVINCRGGKLAEADFVRMRLLIGAWLLRGREKAIPLGTNERTLVHGGSRRSALHVLEDAVGSMNTEADIEHVAFPNAVVAVAVGAILLLQGTARLTVHSEQRKSVREQRACFAVAVLGEVAADGHAVGVVLVQKGANVAFHAQVLQPVSAHSLLIRGISKSSS